MSTPGYSSVIKATGTSTAFTGEAATLLTGTTYQINDVTKRIFDPSVTVIGNDTGSPVTVDSVDFLFGTVTLNVAPSGAVTIDGSYFPQHDIVSAREFDFTAVRAILDTTRFHATQEHRTKLSGQKDLTGSLNVLEFLFDDLDTGGGSLFLKDLQEGATAFVLEIHPGQVTAAKLRAWVILFSVDISDSLEDLVSSGLTFEAAPQPSTQDADGHVTYAFGA